MSYGPFESLEASESEHRIAANAANKTLDVAIVQIKARHAAYLNCAADQHDFYDRLKNVKTSMREICQEHGVHPAAGVMNKVVKACRDEARPHWRRRQAAAGTSVDDAAPSSDLSAPIGTLDENPIGAVASRRRVAYGPNDYAGNDDRPGGPSGDTRCKSCGGLNGRHDNVCRYTGDQNQRKANTDVPGYETQYGIGAGEVTNTTADEQQLASRRVGGGFRDFLQQGVRGVAEGMEPGADESGMGAFFQGLDGGIEGELPPEYARPQHPPLPKGHGEHDWKQEFGEGLSSGIGRGFQGSTEEQAGGNEEFFHQPQPPKPRKPVTPGPEYAEEGHYGSVSDRQYLAALVTGDFEDTHHSLETPLVPEGDFDSYLNQVTDPAADRASTHPFGARDGEHDWENTGGKTSSRTAGSTLDFMRQQHPELYGPGGSATTSDFNFTGSPETQYHHRQKGWHGENDFDQDAMYRQQRAAARHYFDWCGVNRLAKRSVKNLGYFGSKVSVGEYSSLLGAIREAHARKQYRTAAGKDHLQTSQDAITKMLNELAEDFQKSIMPLQDALQSVSYAQQAMQAQSPMNVMPPGSVNVMPEGMQSPMDPMAGAGGAPPVPPMQGQGMPAQPGPGGLSPMVDPAATGGAPAAPAPGGGGDPMAAIPPEILQALMGAGGGGGQPGQAAQRPVARRLQADSVDPLGGLGGEVSHWDNLTNDLHNRWEDFRYRHQGPDDDKGGHNVHSRRLQAEFPFGGGDSEKKDEPPKDDKPKDDGPPKSDGPPKDDEGDDDKPPSDGPPEDQGPPAEGGDGGGEAADKAAVLEAVVALLDAGDIETAQLLADQFQITDADVNGFAPSDPYESGDPYGAAPAGPPPGPPVDAGPPPPPDAGPPIDAGPPPGLPPGGPPMPDEVPPEVKAAAVQYLRWAARHNLPVSRETVNAFHSASGETGFAKIREQQEARAKRKPAKMPTAAEILGNIALQDPELVRAASRRPLVTARR